MEGYLGYFFEHGGQVVSLGATVAVWLALAVLGAVVAGRHRYAEATPLYGWAVAGTVFTVAGVFTPVPFTYLAAGLGGLAVVAAAVARRRGDPVLTRGTIRITVLALPLIVLVSAMVGSQWDEFADWLISPRLMLQLDGLPDHASMYRGGSLSAYPYGWHLITYLVSRLAGRLVENAGALINVFLLLTFGLVVVRLVREALGRRADGGAPGWGLVALGALAATLLNPTFAQKIVLTSYADTATAVCVGFGGVLGWRLLEALAGSDPAEARRLAYQVGLVMLVLVNLKQATIVLVALIIGAVVLAGLRDPGVRTGDLLRSLPAMVLPALVLYAVWRYYVATELAGGELGIRPVGEWLVGLVPEILWQMVVVFSKKGAYFALILAAVVFAVRGLIRPGTPFDRLAVIIGAVIVGYNAFLLFAYVAAFSEMDARRTASLWRYNMHLGPLGVAFAAYGLARLWKTYGEARFDPARLRWLPIALILAAPFVFAQKLRFDRQPPVPYFRTVGADVAALVKPGDRLFVFDPKGTGESAMITRFELRDPAVFQGYHGAFHPSTVERFRSIFGEYGFTHVLVHSWTPETLRVLGLDLAAGRSYLLRSEDGGGWTVERSWKAP
ncbi:MAG: hypothetical protein ACE5GT_00770 [Rhodospirillales bacterium]